MQRRNALVLTGLVLAASIALVTVGQGQSADPPRFELGKAGVGFQDDRLLVAVQLENLGKSTATNVIVTSIQLGPAVLVKPAAVPFDLGDIAPDKDVVLQLAFANINRNGRPPLTIHGRYTHSGRTQAFQVSASLALLPDEADRETREVEIQPHAADGIRYPAQDTFDPEDANEEDEGFPIPEGKLIGDLRPTVPETELPDDRTVPGPRLRALAANDPVVNVRLGTRAVQNNPSSFFPWDPSGASVDVPNGTEGKTRVVFLTGNTYALFSTDGGSSFTKIDPTTIFPNNFDGGLCCDQVVQYVPSIDRMIWFMQFKAVLLFDSNGKPLLDDKGNQKKGRNRMRIASASPAQMIASGATSWTYWDMTSYGTFNGGNSWIDYPDMAFTNNFLHISIDMLGAGLFVTRAPLSEIKNSQTLHIRYTNPADGQVAFGSHLTQDSTDAAYWFGQVSTSSIRIFEWMDNSNSYSWRTRNVNSWLNSDYATSAPNGVDWLSFGFGRAQVRGATVRVPSFSFAGSGVGRLIKVAWSAARGGGFSQPYVRMLDIGKATFNGVTAWTAGNDSSIHNSKFAFQHPYMTTNSNGDIGINVAYGGPNDYPTPLVGFVGDNTMHFANKSTMAINRWGDYSAIRKHPNNPKLFSISDYFLQAPSGDFPNGRVIHQYRLFGRSSDKGSTN